MKDQIVEVTVLEIEVEGAEVEVIPIIAGTIEDEEIAEVEVAEVTVPVIETYITHLNNLNTLILSITQTIMILKNMKHLLCMS